MKRNIDKYLLDWLNESDRCPLILRGARQVGKTYAIRNLANVSRKMLIEINFEETPELASIFEKTDTEKIIYELSIKLRINIEIENSILFLDEIQKFPFIIKSLRWFYEKMPKLPVVACGSLLDFTLKDYNFSMPVGRVSYMFLRPMSFFEFLEALGEENFANYLKHNMLDISEELHKEALEYLKIYTIVGGMPDVVKVYIDTKNFEKVYIRQKNIILSIKDDFNKYKTRVSIDALQITFDSIARQLGNKFTYNRVSENLNNVTVKSALKLLNTAKVCDIVSATAANGLPLGAEIKDNVRKVLFFDTGLALNILGHRLDPFSNINDIIWANNGAIAEQIVGQLILSKNILSDEMLFYWMRVNGGNSEIDYIIIKNNEITPVEVKAGKSGSLKSLHYFMELKKYKNAIRFDTNVPSQFDVNVNTNEGKKVLYTLTSLPIYLAELV